MRLNRGTLLLILVSIGVIVIALIVNNSQVNAPEANSTPTGETAGGPLFAGLDAATLTSFEIRDNIASTFTQLGRNPEGAQSGTEGQIVANWIITNVSNTQPFETDPTRAQTAVTNFAALQSVTSFPLEGELSAFGLDAPNYTLTATDSTGKAYTVKLGTINNANRTYALVNDDTQTIYVIRQSDLKPLTDLIITPPYIATSTPLPTGTNTPNPYSEVEQTQTATIEQVTQTAIAATATAQAEITAEAQQTAAAATAEVTPEATTEQ